MKRAYLLVGLLVLCPFSAPAQDTFHGNVARTGVYASSGPAQLGGVKWTFKTGGPIVGSPSVAGGIVYIGSFDGNLYAVDQETGKEKWKFEMPRQVASTPAIADGVLYLRGYDAVLYALDAATGAVKWRFITEFERRFQATACTAIRRAIRPFPTRGTCISLRPPSRMAAFISAAAMGASTRWTRRPAC